METKNTWDQIKISETNSLFELYHENSKHNLFWPSVGLWEDQNNEGRNKHSSLPLPYIKEIKLARFNLNESQYSREFNKKSCSKTEYLGLVLQSAYGYLSYQKETLMTRTVQSLNGIYPLEIYMFITQFEHVDFGLWHYNVNEHAVSLLKECDKSEIEDYIPLGKSNKQDIILFVTALMNTTVEVQGERAYRNVLIETGKVLQKISDFSNCIDSSFVELSNYNEFQIEKKLDIDGVNHMLIAGCTLDINK